MKKILFTGGGSAGHVVPNLALIEDLTTGGIADVCYMGTEGIEKNIIKERKIPYYSIDCPKLIREISFSALKNNLKIPSAFRKAVKSAEEGLKIIRPDLVFSKGGYVSLPVIYAAHKMKIPCFSHESDFTTGLANRLTANKCECVFTSFPETAEKLRRGKYSGAPIRRSVFTATRAQARKFFDIPETEKVVLIFGGGSGSLAINNAVRAKLRVLTERYTLLHICGKGNLVESNINRYKQFEYISDMGKAYACADVVLSRAGAGTVFEILALKKPAILVPLEGQTRGDQKQNAEYFRSKELCRVLAQKDLGRLPTEIEKAFRDTTLQQNLKETTFTQGNRNILRELKKYLRD